MSDDVKVHELDKRVSILETKDEFFQQSLSQNEKDHEELKRSNTKIDKTLQGINTHIAKQNGALPRMAVDLDICVNKINEQEKKQTELGVKTKLLWAILSSVVTVIAVAIVKTLFF